MDSPVYFVGIAEFDIKKGNILSDSYPKASQFLSDDKASYLADLCLPDGAHVTQEDWTYIVYYPKKNPIFKSGVKTDDQVFGLAMFKNVPDSKAKRGAIQTSMVILSRYPFFDIFEPILREALSQYIETNDSSILKAVYDNIVDNWKKKDSFKLWDKLFSLSIPPVLKPGEFHGASLKKLIKRFGVDTMYIWYALLLEQRILFNGQPAHTVGNFCLAAPLLIDPIRNYSHCVFPYVSLSDTSPFTYKHYICGTTNPIFETKIEWYDMLVSLSFGLVKKSSLKISSHDKEFISDVISGIQIKRGEVWVRHQFYNYTKSFLECIESGHYLCPEHKELGNIFKSSKSYQTYMQQQQQLKHEEKSGMSIALQAFKSLKKEAQSMFDLKKKQLLFDMLQNLHDLNTIDSIIESGGVELMGSLLRDPSAQIRKYAVAVIAQLCISVKGQLHIIRILNPTQQRQISSSSSTPEFRPSSPSSQETRDTRELSPQTAPKLESPSRHRGKSSTKSPRESPNKQQNSPKPKKTQKNTKNLEQSKSDSSKQQTARTQPNETKNTLIPTVINMLKDPMPNVASAACYCLYKVSTLHVGVEALVKHQAHLELLEIICSSNEDNLLLKNRAAATLLQIYLLDPSCPKNGAARLIEQLKRTQDKQHRELLRQILDLWGELTIDVIKMVPLSDRTKAHFFALTQPAVTELKDDILEARTTATSYLLADFANLHLDVVYEIVAIGGVEAILQNVNKCDLNKPLVRLSFACFCHIADTTPGRVSLIENNIIERALQIPHSADPKLLYYIYRFLEICCQHHDTILHFLKHNGIEYLVTNIAKFYNQSFLTTLCLPCFGALKWLLLLLNSEEKMSYSLYKKLQPLKNLHKTTLRQQQQQHLELHHQLSCSFSSSELEDAFRLVIELLAYDTRQSEK
jgi:hypothetical protein